MAIYSNDISVNVARQFRIRRNQKPSYISGAANFVMNVFLPVHPENFNLAAGGSTESLGRETYQDSTEVNQSIAPLV